MALNKEDIDILEEILAANGHCLNSKRCAICPFRAMCLPEFLNKIPPTESERLKMAADVLMHHQLIDDKVELDQIQRDYKWRRQ